MAQSRVLMPQKSRQSQLMPTAMTAVGSYFGYPGLGQAAGQAYSQNQQGGAGAVTSGGGVQAPQQKAGIGAALEGFVSNGQGQDQQQASAPTPEPEQKPSMAGAMDRRMDAMSGGDPADQLWYAKEQLNTMPDYIRKEYGPVIDQALYKHYETKRR